MFPMPAPPGRPPSAQASWRASPACCAGAGRPDGFVEEGVLVSEPPPAMFAQIGDAHSRKYGTTFAQFAKVAVKNHHHATFNPKAVIRRETPLEEVMGSDMIAYPNTKLMCSI